jgi:DNA invertase Pin-like site-specific DNA recombinase
MINTSTTPAKAIIFARVSSESQKENGHSLEAQVCGLQEYCKQQNLEIIQEFQFCDNQASFLKVVNCIKKQQEPVALVVDSIECLMRNFEYSAKINNLVEKGILQLHFLRDRLIIDNSEACKDTVCQEIQELETAIAKTRHRIDKFINGVKTAIEMKVKEGEYIGKAPIGYLNFKNYKLKKQDIRLDTDRTELVVRLFEEYATGKYDIKAMAAKANEMGLTMPTNKPIIRTIIMRVLQNPFYTGFMSVKGVLYKHKYPAIISEELFAKCKDVMNKKGIVAQKYQR